MFPTANSKHRTAALRPSAASSRYPVTTTPKNVPNLAVPPTSPRAGKKQTAAAKDHLWDCSTLQKTAQGVACGGAAAALLALSLMFAHPAPALADSMPGMASGCSSTTNVSGYTIVTCDRQGLDRDGRLLGCRCVPISLHTVQQLYTAEVVRHRGRLPQILVDETYVIDVVEISAGLLP